jgi:dolichol-phosphate mannosyltransferase
MFRIAGGVQARARHPGSLARAVEAGVLPVGIAPTSAKPRVTVVVPTFREAANLPLLLDRLHDIRERAGLALDVLLMDDDSRDGSLEAVAHRPEPWVRMVVRERDHGLSQAVLDGVQRAQGDIIVCMDADLSHPAEAIPRLLEKLDEGADFVVGSRYVAGGTTSDDWGFLRWANSRIATLLARPLTSIRDPMAGFFAVRRTTIERGADFNPVGYKIGLELMVKCRCERVVEVPIHFEDRRYGESKLTLKQQLLYLKHLRRLYMFRFGLWSELVQFLVVGALGTAVNLAVLSVLMSARVDATIAVAAAIFVAMGTNFALNRRFSFSHARERWWMRQFLGFAGASSFGALVNYAVTLYVLAWGVRPAQVAALAGIAAGTGFNFVASRYLVFKKAHVRRPRART